jgi:hypothetical protein
MCKYPNRADAICAATRLQCSLEAPNHYVRPNAYDTVPKYDILGRVGSATSSIRLHMKEEHLIIDPSVGKREALGYTKSWPARVLHR